MNSTDGRGEQGFRAQPQGRGSVFGRLAPGFLPSRELSVTSVLSVPRMSIPPEIMAARSLCACPPPSPITGHPPLCRLSFTKAWIEWGWVDRTGLLVRSHWVRPSCATVGREMKEEHSCALYSGSVPCWDPLREKCLLTTAMGTNPPTKLHPAGAQASFISFPERSQEGRTCQREKEDDLREIISLKMTAPSPFRNKLISLA